MSDLSRRDVVVGTLAAGFALSVQPVSAGTLTTDAAGLTAGEVAIPVGQATIPAYRAVPAGVAKAPVVLVVHEIFGVHEHIEDVCRRLAKQGYFAVAPELFARHEDVSKIDSVEKILPIVSRVPDAQVLGDLDATLAWAATQADADKLGVTGFCWGGRIVWLYAAHQPKVKAGVAWYGRLTSDVTEYQPKHPVDVAGQLKAPVLGLYGGDDTGIPPEAVEKMRAALAKAKSPSEIHVYPGAPHAFFADYRPSYREAPAKDGWGRMLAWFKKNGVA